MSIIGQGAREAFKKDVIAKIDSQIEFIQTRSRREIKEVVGIVNVLKGLKEQIEEMDTA